MATSKRNTVNLDEEQYNELRECFDSIDSDNNGFITLSELGKALECVGLKLPGYELRELISKYDRNTDGQLSMDEFRQLYTNEKSKRDIGTSFKKVVTTRQGVSTMGGTSYASSEGTTHTVKQGEKVAFAEWINRALAKDPDCKHLLLIDPEGDDLYTKVGDGIIFCKLINCSVSNTIDERTINKTNLSVYRKHENLTLAVNSAQAIGCTTVNIGPEDLAAGKPHLVLGLLWQIIRIGLLSDINLSHHPGLVSLLLEGESIDDLIKMSPEQILLRWVNYHLQRAGCDRQIHNFGDDIKDSEAYTYLLHQIAPAEAGVTLQPLGVNDHHQRAEFMLQEANKINCRSFVSPADVVSGNTKLNLAFVANLFNNYPALDKPATDIEMEEYEESREEKTYRNWMNSLGVQPSVYRLYSDLSTGLIIFQLFDCIKANTVNWDKVHRKFNKMKANFEKLENCNYAVELGKQCKFSLVGIDGKDINDGNQTLTLALVWQLMRAYTLSILSKLTHGGESKPIQDREIIEWANSKLTGSDRFQNFSDPALNDGITILKLIDSIKPGIVTWDNVIMDAKDYEARLANARLAVGLARKIGAGVYALPEDIVESKQKMLMTLFACLMTRDFKGRNLTTGLDGEIKG